MLGARVSRLCSMHSHVFPHCCVTSAREALGGGLVAFSTKWSHTTDLRRRDHQSLQLAPPHLYLWYPLQPAPLHLYLWYIMQSLLTALGPASRMQWPAPGPPHGPRRLDLVR